MGSAVRHASLRVFVIRNEKYVFHAFLRRSTIVVMGNVVGHAFLRVFRL